jgi:hypothetical protein
MTTHDNRTTALALRALDAADRDLDRAQRTRAAAALDRIVSTDPGGAAPTRAPRRRRHRPLIAGGVVAAAAAAVVAVPIGLGEGDAFASWAPTPVRLSGADRAAAVEACVALQGDDTGELAFDPTSDPTVLVAEARGGWSYVVYTVAGASGVDLQGSCLVSDDVVAEPRRREGGFFGSLGPAAESAGPEPAPEVARDDSYGVGSVEGELFVHVEGRAGSDVAGILVTTPAGRQVEASLDNGRWAVWWPAGRAGDGPEVTGAPTYRLTLRDGTVRDGLRPPR